MNLTPRWDNPGEEAIDITNRYKEAVQRIADQSTMRIVCFDDYVHDIEPKPTPPSKWGSKSTSKRENEVRWRDWISAHLASLFI